MESSAVPASTSADTHAGAHHDKGLKADAITFSDGLTIALASTAPAYSLAAVIGSIVVIVGFQAPAALLVSFVPMFFIAAAFYYLNKADQDCGTSFSWVTRAIGPQSGWITGWAICVTGILVIGSLADVAAYSFFDLIGAESLVESKLAVTLLALAIIALMTTICVLGTELSANLQKGLMILQIGPLLLFAGVALFKVFSGDAPPAAVDPSLSWFNPFEISSGGALTGALLLGVFIYWGWESAVNLNEETEGEATAPGLAGLISTVILLVTYLGVAAALVAWKGAAGAEKFDDNEAILSSYATGVLGEPLGSLVLLAVVVSALASTQTTILPASRTSLSMARAEAMPSALGEVSKRFFTPVVSTVAIGVLAVAWYLPSKLVSENFLFDSLSALALMIAFYYAFTGAACVVYYRRELTKSVKNFLFVGVAPAIGSVLLGFLFVKALVDYADPENSYTGESWFGIAPPAVIGVGFILLGVVLLALWRRHRKQPFFLRRREVAPAGFLDNPAIEPKPALAEGE
ncbi:MAG TPA: APC family permease [Solirubrobacterales bacterium]|nr:APC family permease [Solirubrobacterales bacterium]